MVGTDDHFLLLQAFFGDHFLLICLRLFHVRTERHNVSFNGKFRPENQNVFPVNSNQHYINMLIYPPCLHRRSYMSAIFLIY